MQHCYNGKEVAKMLSLLSFRCVPCVCVCERERERERERKKGRERERERERVGRAKGIGRREEGKQGVCVCLSVCLSVSVSVPVWFWNVSISQRTLSPGCFIFQQRRAQPVVQPWSRLSVINVLSVCFNALHHAHVSPACWLLIMEKQLQKYSLYWACGAFRVCVCVCVCVSVCVKERERERERERVGRAKGITCTRREEGKHGGRQKCVEDRKDERMPGATVTPPLEAIFESSCKNMKNDPTLCACAVVVISETQEYRKKGASLYQI